jgi:hypothetical protein
MNFRILVPCILTAGMVAACSGGSGNGTVPQQTQQKFAATGTLTLALPQSTSSSARKPAYVGASTGHAEVFINDTLAGSTTSCTSVSCSLAWTYYLSSGSANQSVSFAVEADTGTNAPAHTILSAGANSYDISPGSNGTPLDLTLSGAAAGVTWTAGTLNNTPNPGTVAGTFSVLDAIGNTITSPGSTFDNAPITFTSTPENVGGGSFSTPTALSSVTSDAFAAACTATNGTFQISAIAASSSTALDSTTLSILSGQSPAISYPSAGLSAATVYIYNCTSGVISVQGTGSISAH